MALADSLAPLDEALALVEGLLGVAPPTLRPRLEQINAALTIARGELRDGGAAAGGAGGGARPAGAAGAAPPKQ
ncbi:MAG: hypothetical protein ACFCBW_02185, partial [Candidatus Competibacterales bacterium]